MSLIIFIIISLCIGCWVWKQRNRFILNSDSLHKQWLFRLAIAFPLISSVYFIVWLGAPYPFRFDAYGYNVFLEINKFPLGILALSPILGVFVVYSHRSLQTEKQIKTVEKQLEEAQKKNKVDIYFSQRKFIIEQLENIQIPHYGKIENANHTYDKFLKFDNYDNKLITTSFSLINSKIEQLYSEFLVLDRHVRYNQDNIFPSNIKMALENIKRITRFIISQCGMNDNKHKILNIIYEFNKNYNEHMSNKHKHTYDYHTEINSLLEEIITEMLSLHSFLLKFFTVILLNKDVFDFLPNLDKFNPTDFP